MLIATGRFERVEVAVPQEALDNLRTRRRYRPARSEYAPRAGASVNEAHHIVAGRYRLKQQLGRGGMGVVWRARDERLGRDVALKVLHPWVADDPELRERFEREAAALARLEHPNVVRLYDVLEDRKQTVLVMELVEGTGLDRLIAGRALEWDETRRFCAPVAAALAHAHARGVVHRDLTPANVLVEHGSGRVVVTDFGLARLARSSRTAPFSGILAGTPEYWAPEQATGAETGPATDLYSLGCMLFRLLAGRVPFEGEDRLATGLRRAHEAAPPLASAAPDAPAEAVLLVDRLLQRAPEHRGDASDAAASLGAEPASLPRATSEPTSLPRATSEPTPADAAPPQPTLVTRILREPATIVQHVRAHRARLQRGRLAGVVAALAVAIGLAGGGVYAIAGGEPRGLAAPDVVGIRVAAARAELVDRAREDGLPVPKVKVVDRSYSESAPEGAIIAQDPPEGKRIPETGALLVSVSRGSAYTDVPSVAGLEGAAAFALLERKGFTPSRRYAPSTEIEPWHAIQTEPTADTRVKRPARIQLLVSTGPPRRPVPTLDGLDAEAAAEALKGAGFVPVVEERPDTTVPPGTILGVKPSPGARVPLGSTVTIAVAREPRWEATSRVEGTEDAEPAPFAVPAGARLVLTTVDTSPLGLWGGRVKIELSGDAEGEAEVGAGETLVLADASDGDRTIGVSVDVHGSVHWTLAVEVQR
jgi:beta-lactam-binding protein with PASTA domain